jgi:hypothetical protein
VSQFNNDRKATELPVTKGSACKRGPEGLGGGRGIGLPFSTHSAASNTRASTALTVCYNNSKCCSCTTSVEWMRRALEERRSAAMFGDVGAYTPPRGSGYWMTTRERHHLKTKSTRNRMSTNVFIYWRKSATKKPQINKECNPIFMHTCSTGQRTVCLVMMGSLILARRYSFSRSNMEEFCCCTH